MFEWIQQMRADIANIWKKKLHVTFFFLAKKKKRQKDKKTKDKKKQKQIETIPALVSDSRPSILLP